MANKKIYYLLVLIATLLSLITACEVNNSPIDIGDGGLLSGEPCSAPCFWNIIPGSTTEKQAIAIISSDLSTKKCEHWDTRNSGGTRGMLCSDIDINFNDQDIVNGIGFSPSKSITVGEVIRKYGDPGGISVIALGTETTPPVIALIYFDKVSMVVHLPVQNSLTYNLQPDILIERIVYSERSEYLFQKQSAEQWKGFGKY